MKPAPCFENHELEEAERRSEERKRQAIDRLVRLLDPPPEPRFGWPMAERRDA